MEDDDEPKSGWKRVLDATWDKVPQLVVGTLTALVVFSFTGWITDRDLSAAVVALQEYVTKDATHMERLADCVKRPECEAVRAAVHSIELRLGKVEADWINHQTLSEERKDRILELEREVRELTTNANARPDPFTGTMGRELSRRIERLEQIERPEHKQ